MEVTKKLDPKRALVLFSGGQDSTTCLAYALHNFDYVETVGFDYGQRNIVELECRDRVLSQTSAAFPKWAAKLGPDKVLDLSTFSNLSESALTNKTEEIGIGETGLPTTFVPGRNLFFYSYAAVIAYNKGLGTLIGGMCETDFSGYPDCRDETLRSLEMTLNLGMGTDLKITTPLMWMSKAKSWTFAQELGGDALITIVRETSHSCYEGVRDELHDWGYGCGACPACDLRAKGYYEWQSETA